MTEIIDAQLADIPAAIKQDAITPASSLASLVKAGDMPMLDIVEQLTTLDWKNMKPPHVALLLMQKPFPVSGGGTMFLNFRQAIFFATRAFELGVSPFSNEIWFDPNRYAANLTLEGKRVVARNRGIDIGPPTFEPLRREWENVPIMTKAGNAAKSAGFNYDVGYKCKMRVGDKGDVVEYIAWLSEWYVDKSPVWQQKAEHMLQIRSQEKAITNVLGTGASAMPSEAEIE